MMGKNGHHSTRVIMKDHAFYVPSSLVGKTVLVQGTLTLKRVSEAQRRHYAEDAGATEEEVSGIKGDVTEYVFVASGVKVP